MLMWMVPGVFMACMPLLLCGETPPPTPLPPLPLLKPVPSNGDTTGGGVGGGGGKEAEEGCGYTRGNLCREDVEERVLAIAGTKRRDVVQQMFKDVDEGEFDAQGIYVYKNVDVFTF